MESADTGGAWALLELEMLGANPPLHLHDREDEAFYVLAGHVRVWVGDAEFEGGPGTFVLAPRGVPHTYARLPGENLRLLVIVSPAGFERMFDDVALLFRDGTERPGCAQRDRRSLRSADPRPPAAVATMRRL